MLAEALRREVDEFLTFHESDRLEDGRARLVRHGNGPECAIQTGIGPIVTGARTPRGVPRGAGSRKVQPSLAAFVKVERNGLQWR